MKKENESRYERKRKVYEGQRRGGRVIINFLATRQITNKDQDNKIKTRELFLNK